MPLVQRPLLSTLTLLCLGLVACDGGSGDNRTAEEAILAQQKADEAKKAEREAAKKATEDKKKEPTLELPWTSDAVSGAVKAGSTVTWKVTGKDAKGKDMDDSFRCQVKNADGSGAGITCNTVNKPSKDKGAGQVATIAWSGFGPFFAVERPEHTLVKMEKVKVPAGEFDCVVVELKGFLGEHRTLWMIRDKPGVFARVIDHGNDNAEDDKTELTYELEA
jgi:hypothetical protein